MKVSNIINDNGNRVANQFLITHKGATYFQSYFSQIVMWKDGKTYLDGYYWNFSNTTAKYRRVVLSEGIDQTRQKIKSGEYILTNLNGDN